MCFLSQRENRFIIDHFSRGDNIGTNINENKSKTKKTKVDPKFFMRYLFEKPFSSK